MAASQRPKSASTNKRKGGGDGIGGAVERYLRDLERAPLAARTRDAYGQHVGAYGAWLAGRPEPGVAITYPRVMTTSAGSSHIRALSHSSAVARCSAPSSTSLLSRTLCVELRTSGADTASSRAASGLCPGDQLSHGSSAQVCRRRVFPDGVSDVYEAIDGLEIAGSGAVD